MTTVWTRFAWITLGSVLLLLLGGASTRAVAGPIIVTGPEVGGGPHVRVFDALTGQEILGFMAFDPGFTGGVRVATVDANGDGIPDVVVTAGPGGGPHLRVFDGAGLLAGQLVELVGLFAYDPGLRSGMFVAGGTATPPGGGGGHITAVTGRGGLTGGGTSGAVALGLQSCPLGQLLKATGPSAWGCAADANSGGTITGVTPGAGLSGGGTTGAVSLAVDTSVIQARVTGSCLGNQYVQA